LNRIAEHTTDGGDSITPWSSPLILKMATTAESTGEKGMSGIKRITTQHSYSKAVEAGDFVFIGLHRGKGSRFAEQLESTFGSLKKTLTEYNMTLENLVKVNVWLKNIQDLPEMEKLFRPYFTTDNSGSDQFPARMTATTEFIDADCLMMIDGVAYRKSINLLWSK
jgi:2-iminobutanoate/2-iminopropanoate deaminase